jgi:hypothetical protein
MMNIRDAFRNFSKVPNEEIKSNFMYLFIKSGAFSPSVIEFIYLINVYASGIQLTVLDTDTFFMNHLTFPLSIRMLEHFK